MSTTNIKLESGIQLLARLTKKPDIQNFYPVLFETGPKQNDVIEIFSEIETSYLLQDIICEAVIPNKKGGIEAGVLVISTDGNFNFGSFVTLMRKKLIMNNMLTDSLDHNIDIINSSLQEVLTKINILEVYDPTQLYTTIYNLETILVEYPNVSLIIFDTLTAFYWSEQSFKITKMDIYLKNLIRIIQKVTKEYKTTILYTRPEYFSSSKDSIENLEPCCEHPTLEHINYRIQLLQNDSNSYHVNVKTFNSVFVKYFSLSDGIIKWQ